METRWCIYYGDWSTFSSYDGPPTAARVTGVQVIVETDDATFWRCHVFGEVYGWFDGLWHAAPIVKKNWPDDAVMLRGKLVSNSLFKVMRKEAMRWLHQEH